MSDYSRYALTDSAPAHSFLRSWGVLDLEDEDYAELPDGTYCYGMTLDEAETALAFLTAEEEEE